MKLSFLTLPTRFQFRISIDVIGQNRSKKKVAEFEKAGFKTAPELF